MPAWMWTIVILAAIWIAFDWYQDTQNGSLHNGS